jgi:hypothetical protein
MPASTRSSWSCGTRQHGSAHFHRYLELGSIGALAQDLDRRGMQTKRRPFANGKRWRNSVRRRRACALLRNRFHVGDVVYRGAVFCSDRCARAFHPINLICQHWPLSFRRPRPGAALCSLHCAARHRECSRKCAISGPARGCFKPRARAKINATSVGTSHDPSCP